MTAPLAPKTGNTGTLAFGTSTFTAYWEEIGSTKQDRKDLNTSHLGTTVKHTSVPDDLYEPGEMEVNYYYDADQIPPFAAAETVTLTYPRQGAHTNGATLAGTAYFKSRSTAALKNGALMMGKATIKWDGYTGPTFTPGT